MAKAPTLEVDLDVVGGDTIEKLKSLVLEMANNTGIELTEEQVEMTETDWNALVNEDGKIDIDGTDFITLAELRRLARLRGYVSSKPTVVQVPVYENRKHSTVEWEIVWRDGTIDGSAACASYNTVNSGFKNYTVAIASNRAEARCIRAALGIETCSFEEVGPQDEDLSNPASDQQKVAITALIKRFRLGIDSYDEIFGEELGAILLADGAKKLTHEQAVKAMAALNKHKPAKKGK